MGKPQEGFIKRVSFSRLIEFENCPHHTKLKVIDKIPEPERPLPPGKTEHANDRGTRVHNSCEMFVRGKEELPFEAAKHFKAEFVALRRHFDEGKVSLEGEWGFTKDWEETGYNDANVWLRVKCDAVVHLSKKRILIIDYKTGRKHGNEVKHGEQVQLYAVASLVKFPEVDKVDVELWYLDEDDLTHERKSSAKWLRHLRPFDSRFKRMSDARVFPPKPNQFSCRWCPYRGNACKFGVPK